MKNMIEIIIIRLYFREKQVLSNNNREKESLQSNVRQLVYEKID